MIFPPVYSEEPCPIDSYPGVSVRVLANPPVGLLEDWRKGTLGTPRCADCAALRKAEPLLPDPDAVFCPVCATKRAAYGRALVALYGPSALDLDFSTPEAALAAIQDPSLPEEIVYWLNNLPDAVMNRRMAAAGKKLLSS